MVLGQHNQLLLRTIRVKRARQYEKIVGFPVLVLLDLGNVDTVIESMEDRVILVADEGTDSAIILKPKQSSLMKCHWE